MNAIRNNIFVSMAISFLLGLAVGLGGYWIFLDEGSLNIAASGESAERARTAAEGASGGEPDAPPEGAVPPIPSATRPTQPLDRVAVGEHALVVANQPAGSGVIMSMIAIETDGWVAIHETAADGGLGSILGARRFDAGRYFAEAVDLLRATEEGMTYFAVLHASDGDGEFDHEIEIPLKDENGDVISEEFIATANAASG